MDTRSRNITFGVAVASTVAMLATGCGGNDNNDKASSTQTQAKTAAQAPPTTGGKGAKLALAADPGGQLAFDKKTLSAKAGKTTIEFTNDSQVPHAVKVEGQGVEQETKTITGGKASLTLTLKPGKYEFDCPVDGHEQAGMKGDITVK